MFNAQALAVAEAEARVANEVTSKLHVVNDTKLKAVQKEVRAHSGHTRGGARSQDNVCRWMHGGWKSAVRRGSDVVLGAAGSSRGTHCVMSMTTTPTHSRVPILHHVSDCAVNAPRCDAKPT
jgi:hypothetical protein